MPYVFFFFILFYLKSYILMWFCYALNWQEILLLILLMWFLAFLYNFFPQLGSTHSFLLIYHIPYTISRMKYIYLHNIRREWFCCQCFCTRRIFLDGSAWFLGLDSLRWWWTRPTCSTWFLMKPEEILNWALKVFSHSFHFSYPMREVNQLIDLSTILVKASCLWFNILPPASSFAYQEPFLLQDFQYFLLFTTVQKAMLEKEE